MQETIEAAYQRFHNWNALFSFQEAGAARMENDVIDIQTITSGVTYNIDGQGDEGNAIAFYKAHRCRRRRINVVCVGVRQRRDVAHLAVERAHVAGGVVGEDRLPDGGP